MKNPIFIVLKGDDRHIKNKKTHIVQSIHSLLYSESKI